MPGSEMRNGAARAVTVDSPRARRSRMARRVGSARAAKVASRPAEYLTIWLIKDQGGAKVKRSC